MKELRRIRDHVPKLFAPKEITERLPDDEYSRFSYPKTIKLMDFDVRRYRVQGFGNVMTMLTGTPFGMELLTCSFMPNEGKTVPFLLTDIMTVGKKRTIFVEYYDCTAGKPAQPVLERIHRRYDFLADYAEKPAWYISERTPYSLIKSLRPGDDASLSEIAAKSIRAYSAAAFSAPEDAGNIDGLAKFRGRMINEGNPSSAVLKKVFGEAGAERFFRICVMPLRGEMS